MNRKKQLISETRKDLDFGETVAVSKDAVKKAGKHLRFESRHADEFDTSEAEMAVLGKHFNTAVVAHERNVWDTVTVPREDLDDVMEFLESDPALDSAPDELLEQIESVKEALE